MTLLIQTIVTDLDDTLLGEDGRLSAYTLSVLKRVQDKGIHVVLASGRAGAGMRGYVAQVGTAAPYIACNGAQIIEPPSHRVLDSIMFSVEQARDCVAFARAQGVYIQFYAGDFFCHAGDAPGYSREYAASSGMEDVLVKDLEAGIAAPTPKLLCIGEPEVILRLLKLGKAHFGERVSLTISKPMFLEMTPPGANKGGALNRLSAFWPVDPATTLAFGDSLNDMTMLKWAKYGVAMENARPEVKEGRYDVCPPNTRDGVARFIARHLLKEDAPA